MLNKQANIAREEGRLKVIEANRDVFMEQAKWQIESMRLPLSVKRHFEQLNQNLFENITKRLFEVVKYTLESKISVFNAQIALFNAQNDGFRTLADIFR